MRPYFIINFKTYPAGTGEQGVELVASLHEVVPAGVQLVVAPQAADIYRIREKFSEMQIWAQHVDVTEGRSTGWVGIESVVMAGANGSIINHSEHPLSFEAIRETVTKLRELGLKTCVAVTDLAMGESVAELKPDIIAFEPPELVSTGRSLVEVDPAEAQEFVDKLGGSDIEIVLGAGISSEHDVRMSLKMGYSGVLLSSAVMKALQPAEVARALLAGCNA